MNNKPVILFDGICNFCNASINFILKHDRKGRILFAPLQSKAGQELLEKYGLARNEFESFVLVDREKIYTRASAVTRMLSFLPWYFRIFHASRILPLSWRNRIYDWLARNRYKWFGKKEQCMVPDPGLRSRFLP